jgi:hypothetical protein
MACVAAALCSSKKDKSDEPDHAFVLVMSEPDVPDSIRGSQATDAIDMPRGAAT